jgi:uracil-DNA glycosylase
MSQWNSETKVQKLNYGKSWKPIFTNLKKDKRIEWINKIINKDIENGHKVFPYPDSVFSCFKKTKLDNVKIVILGQDPYHNLVKVNDEFIPQAMGLSFSVPEGASIPSSLKNVFNNMINFGHIEKLPDNGDLSSLARKGVLLLNNSLTVRKNNPGSHTDVWNWFTDDIIKYISENLNNVVFMLWGSNAINKQKLINNDKHFIIKSTHPSGYSYNKPTRTNPAFIDVDHFGQANKYLKSKGIKPVKLNKVFN